MAGVVGFEPERSKIRTLEIIFQRIFYIPNEFERDLDQMISPDEKIAWK